MPALTKPITAVTVSIIAQILCAPAIHRTTPSLHSQKDSQARIADRSWVMICCNRLSESGTGRLRRRARTPWIEAPHPV